MNEPIHPIAREKFISFDVDNILEIWLQSIIQTNEYYGSLFSPKERNLLKKSPNILSSSRNNHEGIYIPCPFKKGSIADIYQKFKRIQFVLRKHLNISLMEIFRIVIPELAIRYEESFKTSNTPLERFLSLTKTQYSIAIAGRMTTLVNSRQCLQHMKIDFNIKSKGKDGNEDYGNANAALDELYSLQQEINSKNQKDIINDIIENENVEKFNDILLDSEKENIISNINFNDISNINQQKNILKTFIKGGNYRTLTLHHCNILQSNHFKDIYKYSPSLLSLKLYRGCSSILSKHLNILQTFNHLTSLSLCDIPNLLDDIDFLIPSLHNIKLVKLSQITNLSLTDSLTNIHIEDCFNLTSIKVYHCIRIREQGKTNCEILDEENKKYTCSKVFLQSLPNLLLYQVFSLYFKEKNTINGSNTFVSCLKFNNFPFYFTKDNFNVLLSSIKQSYFTYDDISILYKCFCSFYNIIQYNESNEGSLIITKNTLDLFLIESTCLNDIKHLDLHFLKYSLTSRYLKVLIHNMSMLNSLNLKNCDTINDKDLLIIFKQCSCLTSINLKYCNNISDTGLEYIAKHCTCLKDINISYCELITDNGLQSIAKNKNIITIDISYCRNITDNALEYISKYCKNISIFILSGCNITNKGLKYISKYCKDLITLDISKCQVITDDGIEFISKNCNKITTFILSNCIQITNTTLKYISKYSHNIIILDISFCNKITNEGLIYISKLSTIKQLNLYDCSNITDKGLEYISKNCNNITHINLSCCIKISDNGLYKISEYCNNIIDINITGCNEITDESLKYFKEYLPNLKHINISCCIKISDNGLEYFKDSNNLEISNISGCKLITDEGLKYLCNYGNKLQNIDISYCNKITDDGLQYISENCPNITHLNLAFCRISNIGLTYIINQCYKLENLNISYCKEISDNILKLIGKNCYKISKIELEGCTNITKSELNYISKICENNQLEYYFF